MKTYLVAVLAGLSLYASTPSPFPKDDSQLTWVDEQIQAILPPRSGVPNQSIDALGDPMKMILPAVSAQPGGKGLLLPPPIIEEPLRLQAIINRSVLINGKWYKSGDAVRSYTVSEIKPGSVLLSGKKAQQLILFLTKPSDKIQITTK